MPTPAMKFSESFMEVFPLVSHSHNSRHAAIQKENIDSNQSKSAFASLRNKDLNAEQKQAIVDEILHLKAVHPTMKPHTIFVSLAYYLNLSTKKLTSIKARLAKNVKRFRSSERVLLIN